MYDAILTTYFPEAAVQMDFHGSGALVFKNFSYVSGSAFLNAALSNDVRPEDSETVTR